jgi:DNA helicase-2/ATP-dependent DNA helicase PcrA
MLSTLSSYSLGIAMQYTKSQQEAIQCIDQHLQIIACAGSGKTQVISQRIIELLRHQKAEPREIIAFTYTEKAGKELKNRILNLCKAELPNQLGLAEMYIGTIHGWCLQFLKNQVVSFQNFSILDDIQQMIFINKYHKQIGIEELFLNPYSDTNQIIRTFSILREGSIITEREAEVSTWLKVLAQYESLLKEHARFDFTMALTEAIKQLSENETMKDHLLGSLKYLVIDEYQDVNPIQAKMIERLTSKGALICVVGDDDQCIYQWRGSDIDYIQKFNQLYGNIKSIRLENNFRSTKGVVDVAVKVIEHNQQRLDKKMISSGHQVDEVGDIVYQAFDHLKDENDWIAQQITQMRGLAFKDRSNSLERGLDFSDFTILLRTWSRATKLMESLNAFNIPYTVSGVNELFEQTEVKASHALFEYLDGQVDIEIVRSYWLTVDSELNQTALDQAIKWLKIEKTVNMHQKVINLQEIFWRFLDQADIKEGQLFKANLLDHAMVEKAENIFYNLGTFSQVINDFEGLHFKDQRSYKVKRFCQFLKNAREYEYYSEGRLNNQYQGANTVKIQTIFQAKGLEFPVVFIPYLNQNYLPHRKPGGQSAKIAKAIQELPIKNISRYEANEEDERRLLYVAITRSQKYLYLSHSAINQQFKKPSLFIKEVLKSPYVSKIAPDYSQARKIKPNHRTDQHPMSLSFSEIKSFFDCEYRFKLISIYGFCQPLNERIGYGSSLHAILMVIHREYLEKGSFDRNRLTEIFKQQIHLPYAQGSVFEMISNKIKKTIHDYLDLNETKFSEIIFAEKEIQFALGDDILINGQIDLVKKSDLVTIIDFKSTMQAQEKHLSLDQLSIYAYGYELLTGEKADLLQIYHLDQQRQSELSALDSDVLVGEVLGEVAEIQGEVISQDLRNGGFLQLKDKIVQTSKNIRENQFERTCESNVCQNCFYLKICKSLN